MIVVSLYPLATLIAHDHGPARTGSASGEHRQVDLGQVHDLDVEGAMRTRGGCDPLGHRRADPAGAGASNDDLQQGLGTAGLLQGREEGSGLTRVIELSTCCR
jgi:hypothetical protein